MLELSMTMPSVTNNPDMWNAVLARDASRDGSFVFAVRSTGIYCRPSCPARRPRREHVEFFPLPEAAEQEGFRACKRCKPRGAKSNDPRSDLVRRICHAIDDHDEEHHHNERCGRADGLERGEHHRVHRDRELADLRVDGDHGHA